MAKTKSYWFPHDTTAFSDMKIETMLSVYNAEGYGLYWIIIETMSMEEGYKLSLTKKSVNSIIAKRAGSSIDVVKEFIKDCIEDFELFVGDGEYFWSNSLLKRMSVRDERSKKAKAKADKRWSKEIVTDKPVKNKIKKTIKEDPLFEVFWGAYDKKISKDKTLSLWSKLSEKDKNACMEYIPKYKIARPDKKYRKNPDTFIRNKTWNDELVSNNQNVPSFDNISGDEHKNMFE